MGALIWQLIMDQSLLIASGVIEDGTAAEYDAFGAAMRYHAKLVHEGNWPIGNVDKYPKYELRFGRNE